MSSILLRESDEKLSKHINNFNVNGENFKLFKSKLEYEMGKKSAQSIITNAFKITPFVADPHIFDNRKKILALGKVQSGKTMFFTTTISLIFDNGYDLTILFGGTKNTLLTQNMTRINKEFSNNPNIIIYKFDEVDPWQVRKDIENGRKVIIIILKNVSSKKSNLHLLNKYTDVLFDIPVFIIDDESDEHTPGAPNLLKKNPKAGITHTVISEIFNLFNASTILFVTATPQANFLLSTLDALTPDNVILIEPGKGYIGGSYIHDVIDNPNIVLINDHDDFIKRVPASFIESIMFFLLSTSYKDVKGESRDYSMLIHPSSLNKVQKNVVEKSTEVLDSIRSTLNNEFDPQHNHIISLFEQEYMKTGFEIPFNIIITTLIKNIQMYKVYEYNNTKSGKEDILNIDYDTEIKHKIFVGGNMLGRGLTIPNLSVTYFYRDSKETAVDTLYQRARWLGYKENYIDIIRVYLTESLAEKFIAVVDSETDMWNTLRKFSQTNTDFRKFDRVFSLSSDKLILTRKSVSKTVTVERIQAGYNYDRSVFFRDKNNINNNNTIVNKIINDPSSEDMIFSNNNYQTHKILTGSFTVLYDKYLENFEFPNNSLIGKLSLRKIHEQVCSGILKDELNIVIMRYKTGQYRSLNPSGFSILELPQSYDYGTGYPGDKHLIFNDVDLEVQIHLVYTDVNNKDEIIPLIALNNKLSDFTIRYVTGENFNEL